MTGGADKYYKLGADIDFAQTNRKSDAGSIIFNMLELDGDGHTVSNFFGKSDDSAGENFFLKSNTQSNVTIKNTNFKGIYLSGGMTCFALPNKNILKEYYKYFFLNCRFSAKINDTADPDKINPFFQNSNMNDCEILLEGTSDFTKSAIVGDIGGCLIKLDLIFGKNRKYETLFKGAISYSGIVGNICTHNQNDAVYTLSEGNILNSYFALNFDKISSFSMSSKFSGINFYDKEVMSNLVEKMPSASNFYALTTEQCKNAEYLQSIDFPCISG